MNLRAMMSAILAGFDLANQRASTDKHDRPWRVTEIRNDQFVILATQHGKKFRIIVKEEP